MTDPQTVTGGHVRRTHAWNEREYGGDKWPAVDMALAEAIAGGERDLSRAVALAERSEQRLAKAPLTLQPTCVMGHELRLPAAVAVGAHRSLVVDSVISQCRPETDLVLELGSGWGRNLAAVWLAGGPANARYVAAEITAAGRNATERLAEIAQGLHLQAIPFDFEHPDLRTITSASHALVFSCHGIGQVPTISAAAIDAIVELPCPVTCVHVEPIGWQIRDDPDCEAAHYGARHDYNRNLWQVLQDAESSGRLRVEHVTIDAVGLNPLHPSSVVIWTCTGAQTAAARASSAGSSSSSRITSS